MTVYRIVCTTSDYPTEHSHIIGVGTGPDPECASDRWTVEQVRRALSRGDMFFAAVLDRHDAAMVEAFTCWCGFGTIRMNASFSATSTLNDLRQCPDVPDHLVARKGAPRSSR